MRASGSATKSRVKLSISLVWYGGTAAARLLLRVAGRPPGPRFVVLYYHAVPARSEFARQLDVLRRRATIVRAAESGPATRGRDCVAITFDDALRSVLENAVPELQRRSCPATIFVPVGFIGHRPGWQMESAADPMDEVMTADELRSLPELVEVGSHTIEHPHLTKLTDDELETELAGSRSELELLLHRPVGLLAFPYGEYDERVVAGCRRAGYERVFGIEPRAADPAGRDFVRGRVATEPTDGMLELFLKARGAYGWMVYASAVKRRLRRLR